jgi:hypothetical protein
MSTLWAKEPFRMASNSRNLVNLDALIPRADLFGSDPPVILDNKAIRIGDLEPCAFYDQFRKPDFQRETANWNPEQVALLIKTFCDEDIIPAIILWQNGPQIFVIDGAHRLSALAAWVRDDYGAGTFSRDAYRDLIPAQQVLMHYETQRMVEAQVGTWKAFKARVPILEMKELNVQWIRGSTAAQAAEAFIRINRAGTEIEPLEVRILRAPRAALSVATRAITRGGSGHRYWRHFRSEEAQSDAPKLGREIYDLMFRPPLSVPIKSMDLPMAGAEYGMGVIRLAFDLVALSNELKNPDSTRKSLKDVPALPPDEVGDETVRFLSRTRRELRRVLSTDPSSFGLHPALYFYSAGGVFQPASLLNMIAWLKHPEKRNRLATFRRNRGNFEDLLIAHPVIVKPATHKLGSGGRTRNKMLALWDHILDLVAGGGIHPDSLWISLGEKYPHLVSDEHDEGEVAERSTPGGRFSRNTKSAITLSDLSAVPRCPRCGGLMHPNGMVADHKEKRSLGGGSSKADGRYVHPVCNSERDKDETEGWNI